MEQKTPRSSSRQSRVWKSWISVGFLGRGVSWTLTLYVGFLVDFLVNLKESMRHPDYSSSSKIGSSCALVQKCTSGYDEQMDDRCKILNASHPGPSK